MTMPLSMRAEGAESGVSSNRRRRSAGGFLIQVCLRVRPLRNLRHLGRGCRCRLSGLWRRGPALPPVGQAGDDGNQDHCNDRKEREGLLPSLGLVRRHL